MDDVAVERATWKALYDIRIDMQAKEKPVKLIYKAAITQNTGEVGFLVFWDGFRLLMFPRLGMTFHWI